MKPNFFFIMLFVGMLLVVLSPPFSLAQSPTPQVKPQGTQEEVSAEPLSFINPTSAENQSNLFQNSETPTSEMGNISPAGIGLVGAPSPIANSWASEDSPAIAYCPGGSLGQYLAVYETNGNIVGQRLNTTGVPIYNAFTIYNGSTYAASNPDVSCDYQRNYFLVVWEFHFSSSDHDIYARTVYGSYQSSGTQTLGNSVYVSQDTINEGDPAVACSTSDNNCLVVFEYNTNNGDIHAQRMQVNPTGSGATRYHPPSFTIFAGAGADVDPAVAWGGPDNRFLVVFSSWTTSHYRVLFRHVYDYYSSSDTDQLPDSSAYYLITLGNYDRNQTKPALAYSPNARRFLVAFEDQFNTAIAAVHVYGWTPYGSGPFSIARTSNTHHAPTVAYSPNAYTAGAGADQFLVAFERDNTAIYGQAVKISDDTNQLDGSAVQLGTGSNISLPDLASSPYAGASYYALVWQADGPGIGIDNNIYGQSLKIQDSVYLPIILR